MKEYLEVGKIVNTHGIQGEVKVQPWADSPEFLLQFPVFYRKDKSTITVQSARIHKQTVLMQLQGVEDVNAAMRLRDTVLYIARSDVALPPGTHFLVDLYGLRVIDADTGETIGVLEDVLTRPAHSIYVVKNDTGREYLIPAVPAFVVETNVTEGFVRVRLIEGM